MYDGLDFKCNSFKNNYKKTLRIKMNILRCCFQVLRKSLNLSISVINSNWSIKILFEN